MNSQLHPIEASELHARRERVFLLLAGIFLGSLALLNVLGISRFIVLASLSPGEAGGYELSWGKWAQGVGGISFALAVGVLPYPITFLCTDLISEFYGRKRANWLVIVGLILNVWVVAILWLGAALPEQPAFDESGLPVIEVFESEPGELEAKVPPDYAFYRIKQLAYGAVVASMIAYLLAQFCDVWLYHFWKRVTKGKHLWLRNNGSTLISQMVDTVAVILISHFYARSLPPPAEGSTLTQHLFMLILTGYMFKVAAALLDTIPFYIAVGWLKGYLEFDPIAAEQENRVVSD